MDRKDQKRRNDQGAVAMHVDVSPPLRRPSLKRTGGQDRDKKKQPFICEISLEQREDGSLVSEVLDEAVDTFGPHLLLPWYDAATSAAIIEYEREFRGLNFDNELDATLKFIVIARKSTDMRAYHFRPGVQDRHGRRDSELWVRMKHEGTPLVCTVHCGRHSDAPRLAQELRDALGVWLKFFKSQFAMRPGWQPGTTRRNDASPHGTLRWRKMQ